MIDTHAHLDDYDNLEEIVKKVDKIIVSGVDRKSNEFVLDVVNKFDNLYGTIGIHPTEVSLMNDDDLKHLEENLINDKIVGLGEVGLDYHYGKEYRNLQIDIFKKQIELAKKYNKTLVIHSRDAIEDTYNILNESNIGDLKVVLHCYSGSKEMFKKFIKFNMKFGISGVVTFKNSEKLKDIVKSFDLKYFLLETDSPYLSPEPFRGKKNEPYNIIYNARKISEIKGISVEEVLKVTTNNATTQFDLK